MSADTYDDPSTQRDLCWEAAEYERAAKRGEKDPYWEPSHMTAAQRRISVIDKQLDRVQNRIHILLEELAELRRLLVS